ncbi:hypothetical protein [Chryseobacterium sp.]|uniref:hypothetical protein n=1 Tax=Chryseobacterium sp. TaxID=1871047 RepID=UPI00321A5816
MINFGKFGDEIVSIKLILRQKVSNLAFEPIILASILLKYFVVKGLKPEKVYCLKANFTSKKNYINIFA